MPPKPIVCTEDILNAAISIVRNKGIENINARSLADELGCSTKPLFRLFKNMDDLKQELFSRINSCCSAYLLDFPDFDKDYTGVALRYISFARNEPNLFKALFMNNSITQTTIADMLVDKDMEGLLNEMSATASISRQEVRKVYKKMWLLSHGIASIVATNSNAIDMEEAEAILNDACQGFIMSSWRTE